MTINSNIESAPDQVTVLQKAEQKFELKDAGMNSTNILPFMQVEFKTAGVYFVEVLVDDVMKLRYPLPLVVPPTNPNPQQPPRAKPAF